MSSAIPSCLAAAPAYPRSRSNPARPMAGLLDELKRTPRKKARAAKARPAPRQIPESRPARAWSPLPEPSSAGLGPSVAELTLGRPPRAPRPQDV